MTSIGEKAFDDCSNLLFDTVTIPGVKLVDGWAVGNTAALPSDLDLVGIRGIGHSAFCGCSKLNRVLIPQNKKEFCPESIFPKETVNKIEFVYY